jgi:hypothetical protein
MATLLALCNQLRQRPLDHLSAECALALDGFFVGYGHASAAIRDPMRRAGEPFAGSAELSTCKRAFLAGPDARTSFHRALDALEAALRIAEPPPSDVRTGPPLIDWILDSIANQRTGLFLIEPTAACLFETLNGYRCGVAVFDPAEAEAEAGTFARFEHWLRDYYAPAQAPWHAILRIYGGSLSVLDKFSQLYRKFLAADRGS